MNIPQLTIISNSNETSDELIVMEKLLQNAIETKVNFKKKNLKLCV